MEYFHQSDTLELGRARASGGQVTTTPADSVERFKGRPGVVIGTRGAARILEISRCGLILRITVPDEVLEWFVEVVDGGAAIAEDWCDYEGYDDLPRSELAQTMVNEVHEFVSSLLERDLRVTMLGRRAIAG